MKNLPFQSSEDRNEGIFSVRLTLTEIRDLRSVCRVHLGMLEGAMDRANPNAEKHPSVDAMLVAERDRYRQLIDDLNRTENQR